MTPWIVIPAYNEAPTIARVIAGAELHAPVLVIDDGSTDGTAAAARQAGAEVIRHRRRLGKGQALRTGITAARLIGATAVITLDGDGQHDPRDVPALLAAAERNPRAIVVGSRLGAHAQFPSGRLNAIRVAGFFVNWVSDRRLEDTQSGFRVYPVAVFGEITTRRGGFVFETEVLVAAAARAIPVLEVPVTTIARAHRRSRFRPLADGSAIAVYLARGTLARWIGEACSLGREVRGAFLRDRQSPATVLRAWWRHPRRRRAAAVAWAMLAAPALLGLATVQLLTGRLMPDLLTPVVTCWYSQDRLTAMESDEPEPAFALPRVSP